MVKILFVFPDLLDDPGEGGEERLVQHRSAGFADGFQTTEGVLVQRGYSGLLSLRWV